MKDEKKNNEFYLSEWIDGRMSDNEFKQLVSESDFLAYKKIKHGVNVLEQLEAPMDDSFAKINSQIESSNSNPSNYKTWFVGIAASIILCFGLFQVFKTDVVTYETGFGEQKTLALLDGSDVILNSKSKLSYDKDEWKSERTLFLEGEAYFKVNKGSTFTVNTANGKIEVLGTQFSVNSTGDFFKVECYEGKVSVTQNGAKSILMPSNHIRKINGFETETWNIEVVEPTWIKGESTFRSVPLKYVLNALESQYSIVFDRKDIDQSMVFTGSFTHNNLEVALKTVLNALQVTYYEKEKNVIKLSID